MILNIKEHEYILEKARSGDFTLSVNISSSESMFLHSRYDPKREAQKRIAAIPEKKYKAIILFGLGLGYQLLALLDSLHEETHVIVVEPSSVIYDLFCRQSYFENTKKRKVSFLIQKKEATVISFISEKYTAESIYILSNYSSRELYKEYYDAIEEKVSSKIKKQKKGVFFVGKGIVAPFIVEDLLVAFKSIGIDALCLPLVKDQGEETLKMFNPDFIFALDGAGLDFPWVRNSAALKVAWYVDNPFYFINSCFSEDLIFCWDIGYIAALKAFGFKNVFHVPLGTNIKKFKPLNSFTISSFVCDVSFVGTLGLLKCDRAKILGEHFSSEKNLAINNLLDCKIHSFSTGETQDIKKYKEILNRGVDYISRFKYSQIMDFESNSLMRRELIRVLADYNAYIFGDDLMSSFESKTCRYKGKVSYNSELPLVYSGSKINLNMTRKQLKSTVNQRIFDVSACKSFFLTDYRPALKDIFPFNIKDICFSSSRELKDKLNYFLKNSKERESLSQEMYKAVVSSHTYEHRAREMLAHIEHCSTKEV